MHFFKKYSRIIIVILIFVLLGGILTYYRLRIWVPKRVMFADSPKWITSAPPLISHACGGIQTQDADGNTKCITYTNSLEALMSSIESQYNVIEVDVAVTTDGDLALTHSWPKDEDDNEIPYSSEEWKDYKIKGKYTSMSFRDLLAIVKDYPEIIIVTDTKSKHKTEDTLQEFTLIYEQALEIGGIDLVNRIIPQFYNQTMYTDVKSIYEWPYLIYTLYKQK